MATKEEIAQSLLRLLTDAYWKENNSNWAKYFRVLSEEFQFFADEDQVLGDILKVHGGLSTPTLGGNTGVNLDYLGSLLGIGRFPGESDTDYRARIFDAVDSFSGGGTKQSIIERLYNVLIYLGWVGTKADIAVVDGWDDPPGSGEYGHIYIVVSGDWTGLTEDITDPSSKFLYEANRVRAAGIKIEDVGPAVIEEWGAEFVETLYYNLDHYHLPEERWGSQWTDENHRWHWTGITSTESLNVTKP